MVFHWILSDFKSLQVSRILLGILSNLINSAFWMVSPRPVISKSSTLLVSIIICLYKECQLFTCSTVFFQFPSKVKVFIPPLLSFNFTLWSPGTAKSTILPVLFFFISDYYKVWPRLDDPFVFQHLRAIFTFHFP